VIDFFVDNAELEMNENCAFNIHISPIEDKWDLNWLKRIATAVIVVDDDFDRLFTNDPTQQGLCFRSNRHANPILRDLDRGKISPLIADCETIEQLIDLINADTGVLWDQRNYAWNFTGLTKNKYYGRLAKNTLEFRSPRATTDINTIIKWIVFVVTFVHASVSGREVGYYDVEEYGFDEFLIINHPPGRTDSLCWENHKGRN
jgi:Putative amidoligase enzyme